MQNIEGTLYFEEIAITVSNKWREKLSKMIVDFQSKWAASANAGLPH